MGFIDHDTIESFASERINLPSDVAAKHRAQVKGLRERLEKKIAADPAYGLVKMLHAGSVAKGTALSGVNDLDTAVYVKSADAPTGSDAQLVPWLADRLYEANTNMSRDQFVEEQHCVRVNFKGSGLDVVARRHQERPYEPSPKLRVTGTRRPLGQPAPGTPPDGRPGPVDERDDDLGLALRICLAVDRGLLGQFEFHCFVAFSGLEIASEQFSKDKAIRPLAAAGVDDVQMSPRDATVELVVSGRRARRR